MPEDVGHGRVKACSERYHPACLFGERVGDDVIPVDLRSEVKRKPACLERLGACCKCSRTSRDIKPDDRGYIRPTAGWGIPKKASRAECTSPRIEASFWTEGGYRQRAPPHAHGEYASTDSKGHPLDPVVSGATGGVPV